MMGMVYRIGFFDLQGRKRRKTMKETMAHTRPHISMDGRNFGLDHKNDSFI